MDRDKSIAQRMNQMSATGYLILLKKVVELNELETGSPNATVLLLLVDSVKLTRAESNQGPNSGLVWFNRNRLGSIEPV